MEIVFELNQIYIFFIWLYIGSHTKLLLLDSMGIFLYVYGRKKITRRYKRQEDGTFQK